MVYKELAIIISGRLGEAEEVAGALEKLAARIREDDTIEAVSPQSPWRGRVYDSQGSQMGSVLVS